MLDAAGDTLVGSQTLGRAIALLRLIAGHGSHGARLLDLASESKLSRPTVHRLLKRLCLERLAAQDPHSKRYVLGGLAFELGLVARSPLRRLSKHRLEIDALAATTEDTAYLVMRTGDELVCLYLAEGAYPIRERTFEVGIRRPLATGAGGLALLAAMRNEDVRAAIARNPEWWRRLGNSDAELLKCIQRARTQGAVDTGNLKGVTGVAVPVPVDVGASYLAVCVGAVSSRISPVRMPKLFKTLSATARRIAVIEASVV